MFYLTVKTNNIRCSIPTVLRMNQVIKEKRPKNIQEPNQNFQINYSFIVYTQRLSPQPQTPSLTMCDHAVINRKVIENSGLKLVFFLALAVARRSLAVHVGSAAQSPHGVEQRVCHRFTRWWGGKNTHTQESSVCHHSSDSLR